MLNLAFKVNSISSQQIKTLFWLRQQSWQLDYCIPRNFSMTLWRFTGSLSMTRNTSIIKLIKISLMGMNSEHKSLLHSSSYQQVCQFSSGFKHCSNECQSIFGINIDRFRTIRSGLTNIMNLEGYWFTHNQLPLSHPKQICSKSSMWMAHSSSYLRVVKWISAWCV